jgi:hypothetical protein
VFILREFKSNDLYVRILQGLQADFLEVRILRGLAWILGWAREFVDGNFVTDWRILVTFGVYHTVSYKVEYIVKYAS